MSRIHPVVCFFAGLIGGALCGYLLYVFVIGSLFVTRGTAYVPDYDEIPIFTCPPEVDGCLMVEVELSDFWPKPKVDHIVIKDVQIWVNPETRDATRLWLQGHSNLEPGTRVPFSKNVAGQAP